MFFVPFEDEWGDILYLPNQNGEALLTATVAFLLLLAMVFMRINGTNVSVGKLFYIAIVLGVATVFSNINIISLPTGGNITLFGMLFIMMPGYWYGLGCGIASCAAYGVFQIITDPYIISLPQLIVDYILAFAAMGAVGFFYNKKNGLIKGYIIGIFGRYIFAVISGWVFFGMYAWEGWSPFLYSLVYNGIYIFAEAIITILILFVPPIRNSLEKLKQIANSERTQIRV